MMSRRELMKTNLKLLLEDRSNILGTFTLRTVNTYIPNNNNFIKFYDVCLYMIYTHVQIETLNSNMKKFNGDSYVDTST